MMVDKEILKSEIDKVPSEHYGILYEIIRVPEKDDIPLKEFSWVEYINSTYGSLVNSKIYRSDQGEYEIRQKML